MLTDAQRYALACLAMMFVALHTTVHAQPAARVIVDQARLEPVEQYREVVGELRALRRTLLAAEDEGLIVEFSLQDGDAVEAGQVVARLRDARVELEVRRAQADVAARQAALAERTADLERTNRDLARINEIMQLRGSATQSEIEDRRTAVRVAEARLEHAAAELESASASLELALDRRQRRTVTAPFGGFVTARRTEIGQWVRQGDPIIELVALEELEARLHIPESLVRRLRQSSDPLQVRIPALDATVAAQLVAIVPDADPRSRLVPVRLRLDNSELLMHPGMSAVGLVATGTREPTLTVHKDAILRDDAGEFIFFDGGGAAVVARVQTLFPAGERIAVRSGTLQPGMAVIVEGNERLFPTQPLNIAGERSALSDAAPGAEQPREVHEGQGR